MRPIGALVFGIMADRLGRRLPLMLNVIFYALLSVLSGLAPNYQVFLALRMLFARDSAGVSRNRRGYHLLPTSASWTGTGTPRRSRRRPGAAPASWCRGRESM